MATTNKPLPPLTRRQTEAVQAVRVFVAAHGYPPTMRELGDALRITPNAARGHLAAAERKGAVRRTSNAARAVVVIADHHHRGTTDG